MKYSLTTTLAAAAISIGAFAPSASALPMAQGVAAPTDSVIQVRMSRHDMMMMHKRDMMHHRMMRKRMMMKHHHMM